MKTILENFRQNFRYIYDDMQACYSGDSYVIAISGCRDIYIYDNTDGTIRRQNNCNIDELRFIMSFSDRLKKQMNKQGIDAMQLANDLGIGRATVFRYFKGISVPNFYTVYKIATVLNCGIDDLIQKRKTSKIDLKEFA